MISTSGSTPARRKKIAISFGKFVLNNNIFKKGLKAAKLIELKFRQEQF